MITRIGPAKPFRPYLKEWREKRGLTQQMLADRIDTSKDQISRWERGQRGLKPETLEAYVSALNLDDISDLYRHPDRPSADQLLQDYPAKIQQQAIELLTVFLRAANDK